MLIHWINWREFVWIVNFQLPRIPPLFPPTFYNKSLNIEEKNCNLRLAVCETNQKKKNTISIT